jgi:hypothetical protein
MREKNRDDPELRIATLADEGGSDLSALPPPKSLGPNQDHDGLR